MRPRHGLDQPLVLRLIIGCAVLCACACETNTPAPPATKADAAKPVAAQEAPAEEPAAPQPSGEAVGAASRSAYGAAEYISYRSGEALVGAAKDPCDFVRATREPNSTLSRTVVMAAGLGCAEHPALRGLSPKRLLQAFGGDPALASGGAVAAYTYYLGPTPGQFRPARLHFCFVAGKVAEVHFNTKHGDWSCPEDGRRLVLGPQDTAPRELPQ